MGACLAGSTHFVPNKDFVGQSLLTPLIAESLGMNSGRGGDVDALFHAFCKYDMVRVKTGSAKASGWIDIYGFFLFNEIAGESLARHLVDSCFQPKPETNDMVDFEQFMVVVWHLVTVSEKKLAAFMFSTFDRDHDGYIVKDEVDALVDAVSGSDAKLRERLHAGMHSIGGGHNVGTKKHDFERLVKETPSLLFPVFQMQLLLRERTVGARFLNMQRQKEAKFSLDKTLPEIIEMLDKTRRPLYLKGYVAEDGHRKGSTSRKGSTKVAAAEESKTGRTHGSHTEDSSRHGGSSPHGGHSEHGHRRSSSKDALNDMAKPAAAANTKHKHDYIAEHSKGTEMHAATEHHEYLLHPGSSGKDGGKDSSKKDHVVAPRTPRGGTGNDVQQPSRRHSTGEFTPLKSHGGHGDSAHHSGKESHKQQHSERHHGDKHHSERHHGDSHSHKHHSEKHHGDSHSEKHHSHKHHSEKLHKVDEHGLREGHHDFDPRTPRTPPRTPRGGHGDGKHSHKDLLHASHKALEGDDESHFVIHASGGHVASPSSKRGGH